jgi:homoserine kinase
MTTATVFAPASIGNVGPGFDVLGLAVDGLGDRITVTLISGPARIESVTGRDAELVPRDAARNVASIAALAWLRTHGDPRHPVVSIEKGLPLAGGLGGSAASSVGGALAAALAAGAPGRPLEIIAAALEGESAVAGRHLDNISPCVFGGLALSRSVDPIDALAIPVQAPWWVALVTPDVRVRTKEARALLPQSCDRAIWVQQMANTAALVHAFASGDGALLRRSLDDLYAEPRRASLIPHFHDVKRAALEAGSIGCSISGSGPTIFAMAENEPAARRIAAAMRTAFGDVASTTHVGAVARRGAHAIDPFGSPATS